VYRALLERNIRRADPGETKKLGGAAVAYCR
jgi:hypothetical protein